MLRNNSFSSSFKEFRKLCENGHLGNALETLRNMEHYVAPSMYHCLLQGCSKKKDLLTGRHAFSLITKIGLFPNAIFGAVLIRMLAACGSLQEAQWVFSKFPHPDIWTWTAIISAHANFGQHEQAIRLYGLMQQSDLKPDQHVFVVVLKACTAIVSLTQGMLLHSHIIEIGLESDTFVGNALIDFYTKCRNLQDGKRVFDVVPNPSVVTWTMMIVGFTEQGHGWEAVQLFWQMQVKAITEPDTALCICVLKACIILVSLDQGHLVHAKIVEESHEMVITVSNTLIDMYAKCGSLEDARNIFENSGERSLVTWNTMIAAFLHRHGQEQEAFHLLQLMEKDGIQPTSLTWNSMIAGLVQQGQAQQALELFHKLLREGIEPDKAIFVSVLKGCSVIPAVNLGWLVHAHIVEMCYDLETTICNTLIDMYGRCGSLQDASNVFERTSKQSVVAWTAVISGYLQRQQFEEAFFLFEQMQDYRVEPNYVTFLSMIKGCSDQASLGWGRAIHNHIITFNFEMDSFVGNCLIDMYTKCRNLEDACSVFQTISRKSVVTWTAMVAGFAQTGNVLQAYNLFKQMQHDGVQPNIVTWNAMLAGFVEQGHDADCLDFFQQMLDRGMELDDTTLVSVLKACGNLALLNQGFLIHCVVVEGSLEHDVYVYNTLIDMYVKCGSVVHARRVFDALPKQGLVACNAMLGGCSEHLLCPEAGITLFEQLEQKSSLPNQTILHYPSLLAHSQGKPIPSPIIESNFISNMIADNALIDMYAVCGHGEDACKLYAESFNPDVVTSSAMTSEFTQPNSFKSAMEILSKMHLEGLKPDDVTFISLLSACSQMGLVHEGCQLFSSMIQDHGITPKLDHFNCLVSLISNSGCWSEAEDLLQTMPFHPDIVGWTSLLCRSHGNINLGERCFEQVISLDHRDAAGFQQMSSMYADAGMWKGADQVEDWRQFSNSWKKPGKAFVEIDDVAHGFMVGDKTHAQAEAIYVKMQSLSVQLKLEGYTPQAHSLMQALDGSASADGCT